MIPSVVKSMSSDTPNQQPRFAAFMSYAQFDDLHHNGDLTSFREILSREVQAQTGQEFPIFQDRLDISWGENWRARIEQALEATTFLIPIITPSFFRSSYCREEIEKFARRERDLGRDDLILPIYFMECPSLMENHDASTAEGIIASRQMIDWRKLRFKNPESPKVRKEIAKIASQIVRSVLRRPGDPGAQAVSTKRSFRSPESVATRVIHPGSFWMGTNHPAARNRERPAHYVTLLGKFRLSRFPITVNQFEEFVRLTDYKTAAEKRNVPLKTWRDPGFPQEGNHPVVCVSWLDALEYCFWLNTETGTSYRLPTEAEWEFACRAGSSTLWSSGNNPSDLQHYAWLKNNSGDGTRTVGTRSPNPLGLYDMHGNVWEWCADWFGPYEEQAEDSIDPKGPTNPKGPTDGIYRIARGGSWVDSPQHATSSFRCRIKPFQHASNIGFRVAVDA